MRAKGSQDLLGPSTKRAIDMILAGHTPEESGRYGTTNGAAMRIAPVGIAADVSDPAPFIRAVIQACQVTHNTSLGISSAAAVAAVVSAGINGADLGAALNIGSQIAQALSVAHKHDISHLSTQDQWGTAQEMSELVARESFNDIDKGLFVAPPVRVEGTVGNYKGQTQLSGAITYTVLDNGAGDTDPRVGYVNDPLSPVAAAAPTASSSNSSTRPRSPRLTSATPTADDALRGRR